MTQRITLSLWNPVQAHESIRSMWPNAKALLTAGHRLVLELRPMSKSREQEEKYHAIIGEIAGQAKHLGSKWGAEDWKRLLIDKFARDTNRTHGKVIPNLDSSGVVEVGILSRKFSKADGSEFIEWLHAWAADNGVELSQ